MLTVSIWLVVGGVIGSISSIVMRTDKDQGLHLDVVVGVGDALLAGFINSSWSINRKVTLGYCAVVLMRSHRSACCGQSRA